MMHDSGLSTRGKKWIKMRMKKPIRFNSKGIEIITWCSFIVWLCTLLSSHHCCMCCHCWFSLHHICSSQVSNDDIHRGPKAVFDDKDIHLSSNVVGNLPLNMCSTLQNNNCDNISKCIVVYYAFTPTRALK
jgi:hypothetical protein